MRDINITAILKTITGKTDIKGSLPGIYLVDVEYKGVIVQLCVIQGAVKDELGPGWRIPREHTFKSAATIKAELLEHLDKIDQQVTNYDEFISWLEGLG